MCTWQALSSRVSDHFPLLIVGNDTARKFRGFRFEAFWPRLQGYNEVVALRKWAKGLIGQNKVLMCAAGQLIAILDVVQEYRALSDQEIRLRRDLKLKFLGMAAVEKLRAKQSSREFFLFFNPF
jgi:hypothetical protein